MTKFNFFVLLSALCLTANGQINKQSILFGAQLFYYQNKNQTDNLNEKSETGRIGISIGKAFKENKILGLNISFSPIKRSRRYTNGDTITLTSNRFDIGFFYREYKRLAKDFYFFSQLDAAYVTENQTENYKLAAGNVKTTYRGGFISLTPGISYQVFRKMQLEVTIPNLLSLNYLVTKVDSDINQVQNSKQREFLFYSNITRSTDLSLLGVGFRFIL